MACVYAVPLFIEAAFGVTQHTGTDCVKNTIRKEIQNFRDEKLFYEVYETAVA